jgi:hypothetical protein
MGGLAWLSAVRTSASSRSCATMRPWSGEALGATGPLGSVDGEGRCTCGIGMAQAVRAAGLCGSCGKRRLGFGTAPAGDARREEGDDGRFGLACAVRTGASSRSCATMRPSGGEALRATGPLVSVDGEGRCACGFEMVQAVWAAGQCGSFGEVSVGLGTAPAGDARREEGDDARCGLACAGRTSASSRSCMRMRPSGCEALGATAP